MDRAAFLEAFAAVLPAYPALEELSDAERVREELSEAINDACETLGDYDDTAERNGECGEWVAEAYPALDAFLTDTTWSKS